MKKLVILSMLISSAILIMSCSNSKEKKHEYVDLGLSVKWATMNIGATLPEDNGSYFAWGEIKEKKRFWSFYTKYSIDNYKWSKGNYSSLTKYNTRRDNGEVDNKDVLDFSDDAASEAWGGLWRMPTLNEMEELIDECSWTWISQNGRSGFRVTGPSGNSIFLPAAGAVTLGEDDIHLLENNYGWYWTSSLCLNNDNMANALYIHPENDDEEEEYIIIDLFREGGSTIRPVCP